MVLLGDAGNITEGDGLGLNAARADNPEEGVCRGEVEVGITVSEDDGEDGVGGVIGCVLVDVIEDAVEGGAAAAE